MTELSRAAPGSSGFGARDVSAASVQRHELIVVGGGVQGACATLEAARRGIRVLLLERDDFFRHSSANSLQILHGGFRYLQSLDLRRLRESVRARSWWMEHFPELTETLECVLPLDGRGLRRPEVFRWALAANELLSRGAGPALPPGRVIPAESRDEIANLFGARPKSLAVWFDGLFPRPARLASEVLHWAVACGATVLSYVEAKELLLESGSGASDEVAGVRAVDGESGSGVEFWAPRVLNFTGVWGGWWGGGAALHPPSIAFNLLLRGHLPQSCAIGVPGLDGKNLFLWEREGCIHAGTRHRSWSGPVSAPGLGRGEVSKLIDELAAVLPGANLSASDLVGVQVGYLPARRPGAAEMAERDLLFDHGANGGPRGFVSVSGVKYTTAPIVAASALRLLFGASLPGLGGGPRPAPRNVPSAHELARRLGTMQAPGPGCLGMDAVMNEEMAWHLDDLVLGRLDGLGLGSDALSLARAIGHDLAWSGERIDEELARLEARLRWYLPELSG